MRDHATTARPLPTATDCTYCTSGDLPAGREPAGARSTSRLAPTPPATVPVAARRPLEDCHATTNSPCASIATAGAPSSTPDAPGSAAGALKGRPGARVAIVALQ